MSFERVGSIDLVSSIIGSFYFIIPRSIPCKLYNWVILFYYSKKYSTFIFLKKMQQSLVAYYLHAWASIDKLVIVFQILHPRRGAFFAKKKGKMKNFKIREHINHKQNSEATLAFIIQSITYFWVEKLTISYSSHKYFLRDTNLPPPLLMLCSCNHQF